MIYLITQGLAMGLPPVFVYNCPIGELKEIVDCNAILNGNAEEKIEEKEFIPDLI